MNYSLYAESTPNPEVMKFVSNRILSNNTIEIRSVEAAKNIPIAKELFSFPFVKSVFLSKNFISITKISNVLWEDIAMQLRVFILEFLNNSNFSEDNIDVSETISENKEKSDTIDDKDFIGDEKEISNLINEYIKPAVESDGGSITLDSFDDGVVTVILSGACSGCPSSTLTLKQGVENLLKQKLGDKIKSVVSKNR
tara:strand:- start:453 stop:1043 length:591 start_codon:yes stop_codon:yes gene_type:complete